MATYGVHGEYQQINLKPTGRDEFSNPNRSPSISIYTLDDALRKDLIHRIGCEPRLRGFRLRWAGGENIKDTVAKLEKIALESRNDTFMIMDARRSTLTLLRQAFNHAVTLNRRDFSRCAFSVVIADGPPDLLKPEKKLNVFLTYLLELKRDFCQALYFYDPLIHYQSFETLHLSIEGDWAIDENLPQRLKRQFVEKRLIRDDAEVKVRHIRKHFRGIRDGRIDPALQTKRMAELADIYGSRIRELWSDDPAAPAWLEKQGYPLSGYGPVYLYPFFFEQLLADLLEGDKNKCIK